MLQFEIDAKGKEFPKDVQEVVNYVRAINYGLARLKDLPLSLRLIPEIHAELLKEVRGAHRAPGEFRSSQNWIGPSNCTLEAATFVPPPVPEMHQALDNLEEFLRDTSPLPALIHCGLAPAQFETIHPFLDGNGRVGRLLITILLCQRGRLPYKFDNGARRMKKMTRFTEAVVLACFLPVLASSPARGSDNPSVVLVVDTAKPSGPIDLTRYALGQGGLSEQAMILDRADQIGQLHPRTIRLFVQEYFDLYPAHHEYHWATLDRAIEAILATGAKPIMNLCFKPRVLYPQINHEIVDPTDYGEWEELIYRLVKHCNEERKFGIEYWEVANEGDIGESSGCPYKFTPQNYVAYYQHTVSAIRRADPQAKVGGPALASAKSPLGDALIDSAGQGQTPLDFLSWHLYNNDPREFWKTIDYMQAKLAKYPNLKNVETILDEWNMSLRNPVLNPSFQPAFILETTLGFYQKGLSRSSYYHIRDYFVDAATFSRFMSARGTAFMAHWWNDMPQYDGLYDNQNRLRPAYYAFKLLSLIKGDQLPVAGTNPDLNALAARAGPWVNVVLWNFPLQGSGNAYDATVQFPSTTNGDVRLVRLNPDSPNNNLEQISNGAIPDLARRPLRVTLRPYDIYWIEVSE